MELPRSEMQVLGPTPAAAHDGNDETDEVDLQLDAVDVDELSWQPDSTHQLDAPSPSSGAASATKGSMGPLATAAELERGEKSDAPGVSPEVFHQGMVVRHPEYGLGKIVALGGSGPKRSATVAFASDAGEKNFVLAKSPLRPVKSKP
jgi:DNA helicase-2/ATP-dependent DNA helicase PcrA